MISVPEQQELLGKYSHLKLHESMAIEHDQDGSEQHAVSTK